MRILIIHNHYQDPGGEDVVFEQERSLLASTETVSSITFDNRKGWQGVWQTLWSPWNIWAARRIRQAIRQHQPDVVHIHNLHYAIGPIAIRAAKRMGIPVVMTLHNYRLLCPSATLFYNGKLFTASIRAQYPWRAVRLGVHSHSMFKTFWLATTTWLHKKIGTWQLVDRYIALTDFARQLFVDSSLGIPAEKFMVKPNFVADVHQATQPREKHMLFIGRLTEEKGISVLLEAFKGTDFQLRIAGNGPLRDKIRDTAGKHANITYLGALGRAAIDSQLASCTALVFPSIWYEGMPITLLEAFATGTPVIASDLGAMQSMVYEGQNGVSFPVGDAQALRQKMGQWLAMDDASRQRIGNGARLTYEQLYTAKRNKTLLLDIYRSAILSMPSDDLAGSGT
ncbi:glycosyltransferase family 4 protein [Parapedobacter koreensis]|uniref:Glycosyltransferase involved in cell wall bisynthesis n=1 Tax=Parapedobacter koreensis TaxID=332977 RepID=A0A1H7G3Q7_9SPHI|nr:glycosyltransferase family 4 protein [Parapedobacter koreensis]SEK31432.1 Glycosyltransferase involved in cell wall bisynthesis [Parapedobacter koreensis]